MKIKKLQIKQWSVNVSLKSETVSQKILEPLQVAVENWAKCFPKENTFINRNWGVPSILINVDLAVSRNGTVSIFDIDETPHNVGIAYEISGHFKNKLD